MTSKRKIAILKRTIRAFKKILPKFDNDAYADLELKGRGICNNIFYQLTNAEENIEKSNDKFFQEEFKLRLPIPDPPMRYSGWCWSMDKRGYQARIKACEKAIERLSK